MLQSLRNYSPEETAAILASVVKDLLPEELIEPTEADMQVDSHLKQVVLAEVFRKLKISVDDDSEASQAQVINLLGKEMSRAILGAADLREIKQRVGQQGNLPPSAYKVVLTSEREKLLERYGISRAQAKAAVSEADDFQHLLPGLFGPTENDVSLFIKNYQVHGDPFTVLVQARRSGATLIITEAFKIYCSDVDVSLDRTPLNVLLAFIGKYGVSIVVGNETATFFLYKSIPRQPFSNGTDFFSLSGVLEAGTEVRSGFHFMVTESSIEVAVGYVINETKYLADLKKHHRRI